MRKIVTRLLIYEGPAEWVDEQVEKSLQGRRTVQLSPGGGLSLDGDVGCISAVTLHSTTAEELREVVAGLKELLPSVYELGISFRVLDHLRSINVMNTRALLAMTETEVKNVKGVGSAGVRHIKHRLAQHGLSLKTA